MDLTLIGHDDRYAVEQLLLALFPENAPVEAVSRLFRSGTYITVRAEITLDGKKACAARRLKAAEETVRLRRRALQQSVYLAAVQLLPGEPAWGAYGPPSSPPGICWRGAPPPPPRKCCGMCISSPPPGGVWQWNAPRPR